MSITASVLLTTSPGNLDLRAAKRSCTVIYVLPVALVVSIYTC